MKLWRDNLRLFDRGTKELLQLGTVALLYAFTFALLVIVVLLVWLPNF